MAGHSDLARTNRVAAEDFADHLKSHPDGFLLDVRTPNEFTAGAMPGATLIPLRDLRARLDEVPSDRHVSIYCGSGYRSATAMGFLQAHGVRAMTDLLGGWTAWQDRT